jgi:hypothetical protein
VLTAKFLVAAAFVMLTAGCGPSIPGLDVLSKKFTMDMMRDAPVVIIGEPKSGELVAVRDHRCLLKYMTTIENVLRGEISGQTADFYVYKACDGAPMRGCETPQGAFNEFEQGRENWRLRGTDTEIHGPGRMLEHP